MSERWNTVETSPDIFLIEQRLPEADGLDVIRGSIARMNDDWCVEILWSGPSGDIKAEFKSCEQARAFVEGVEKTLMALAFHDPRLKP